VIASYHNHTRWSDGKDTIGDLVAAATPLGIDELGISDHFVLHPRGKQYSWSLPTDQLGEYVDAVLDASRSAPLPVRLGLEVDWFPGHAEAIAEALAPHPFDYLIGSVHEVHDFVLDGSPAPWQRLSQAEVDEVHRAFWQHVRDLAASGLVDIIAHLDLAKKFDFHPSIDLGREQSEALDAIAAANLVVELNTAGWHKPCRDAYPTEQLLRACADRGIRATLSADAHQADHLHRDFDRGLRRLKSAGYRELARFKERRVTMDPIEACG